MFSHIISSISSTLDLNAATLSGCTDIIVVRQHDGELRSTPFHVRFGKGKVLRSREKEVSISVNGRATGLRMTLGAAGEGYFEQDIESGACSSDEYGLYHGNSDTTEPSKNRSTTYRVQNSVSPTDVRPSPSAASSVDRALARPGTNQRSESGLKSREDKSAPKSQNRTDVTTVPENAVLDEVEVLLHSDAAEVTGGKRVSQSLSNNPEGSTSSVSNDGTAHVNSNATGSLFCQWGERGVKRRTLRPTPAQLASMGLHNGANRIVFTVTSALQGKHTVAGSVYLWSSTSKIIVSDVDGTITKSDVLGQIMPIFGRDWSHSGVAELFSKCRKSNYEVLYLTARAIGQADATRDYLFGLRQGGGHVCLPDGPLIMSPDRLFPSFKREVIDHKPYVFKIAALRDIHRLFPEGYNPFYAGFGNRDTDHRAYVHIGIPESRIYIIDRDGTLHHVNASVCVKTYASMGAVSDRMFPTVPKLHEADTYTLYAEDDTYITEHQRLTYHKRINSAIVYGPHKKETEKRAATGRNDVPGSGLFSCFYCPHPYNSTGVETGDVLSPATGYPNLTSYADLGYSLHGDTTKESSAN